MISSLKPDDKIPAHIYELASSYNVGTPLMKHKNVYRFPLFEVVYIYLAFLVWTCYDIYGYIAFTWLLHSYPTFANVPANQQSSFIWLKTLHDDVLLDFVKLCVILGPVVIKAPLDFLRRTPNLYLCSEGLVLISRKKVEAIRWDEVEHLYLQYGKVSKLERKDKSAIKFVPILFSNAASPTIKIIIEEVTRCQLPRTIASFEAGEVLTFGHIKVNDQDIAYSTGRVKWDQLEAIKIRNNKIRAFYREIKRFGPTPADIPAKWHHWAETPDNYLLFLLVEHVLAQRPAAQTQETSATQPSGAFVGNDDLARKKVRWHRRVIYGVGIPLMLCVQVVGFYYYMYQPALEQQHKEQIQQQLMYLPYLVHVPGEHCDKKQGYWSDYEGKNIFTCRQDGLLMTLKDPNYQDQTAFSFNSVVQSTSGSNVVIPHHYRIQIKAIFISSHSDCVGLLFHMYNSVGGQEFLVCNDGSWNYERAEPGENTFNQLVGSSLSSKLKSFVLTVDVTDTNQTLYVDNKEVASELDSAYTSTDEIDLILCGGEQNDSALFSDFRYTPFP
jgi:hypothetical protein